MILHQFSLEHKELKPTDFNDLQQIDGGMKMKLIYIDYQNNKHYVYNKCYYITILKLYDKSIN